MFLTLITFLPLVGALIITLIPKEKVLLIKQVALTTALIVFALSVMMLFQYDTSQLGINNESSFQFVEHHSWIPVFNIEYFMGVDGLSFPMVLLTTLIAVIALIASWNISKSN